MNLEITPLAAHEKLRSTTIQLLDVRSPEEHAEDHLDGLLIPLPELAENWQQLDKTLTTIVYCHAGVRSYWAAKFLQAQGFTEVYSLAGGIAAWRRAGY